MGRNKKNEKPNTKVERKGTSLGMYPKMRECDPAMQKKKNMAKKITKNEENKSKKYRGDEGDEETEA